MPNTKQDLEVIYHYCDKVLDRVSKGDNFPVSINFVWKFLGYSQKANAQNAVDNPNRFYQNIDYKIVDISAQKNRRCKRDILLTLECFKQFCLLHKSGNGIPIWRYLDAKQKQLKETPPVIKGVLKPLQISPVAKLEPPSPSIDGINRTNKLVEELLEVLENYLSVQ